MLKFCHPASFFFSVLPIEQVVVYIISPVWLSLSSPFPYMLIYKKERLINSSLIRGLLAYLASHIAYRPLHVLLKLLIFDMSLFSLQKGTRS